MVSLMGAGVLELFDSYAEILRISMQNIRPTNLHVGIMTFNRGKERRDVTARNRFQ
jgi:hypothetical protein